MLNDLICKVQQQGSLRRAPPVLYPTSKQHFVIEVELSHADRMLSLLTTSKLLSTPAVAVKSSSCLVSPQSSNGHKRFFPTLIFNTVNPALTNGLQTECLKYITRIFKTPYTCSDPVESMKNNTIMKALIATHDVTFRLQTSPKELERQLVECLSAVISYDRFKAGTRSLSHIIQVVYCESDGYFRWGVVKSNEADQQFMTATSLWQKVEQTRPTALLAPVCR